MSEQISVIKANSLDLCQELRDDLETTLPAAVKVTAALTFFASGTFQGPVGDSTVLGLSTISNCVSQVTAALLRVADHHIPFLQPICLLLFKVPVIIVLILSQFASSQVLCDSTGCRIADWGWNCSTLILNSVN